MSASALLERLRLRRTRPAAPAPPPPPVRDAEAAAEFLTLVRNWGEASDAARAAEGALAVARSESINARDSLAAAVDADAEGRGRFRYDGVPERPWGADPAADVDVIRGLEAEVWRLATRLPVAESAAGLARLELGSATAALARDLRHAPAAAGDLDDRVAEAGAKIDAARVGADAAISAAMAVCSLRSLPVSPAALRPMLDGSADAAARAAKAARASAVEVRRQAEAEGRELSAEATLFEAAIEAASAHELRPEGR